MHTYQLTSYKLLNVRLTLKQRSTVSIRFGIERTLFFYATINKTLQSFETTLSFYDTSILFGIRKALFKLLRTAINAQDDTSFRFCFGDSTRINKQSSDYKLILSPRFNNF